MQLNLLLSSEINKWSLALLTTHLLLLFNQIGHSFSQEICDQINQHQSLDLLTVGFHGSNLLLITSKPDYLVYELPDSLFYNATNQLDLSSISPIALKSKWPSLYSSSLFEELKGQADVFSFTIQDKQNSFLTMLAPKRNDTYSGLIYDIDANQVLPKSYHIGVDATELQFISFNDRVVSFLSKVQGFIKLYIFMEGGDNHTQTIVNDSQIEHIINATVCRLDKKAVAVQQQSEQCKFDSTSLSTMKGFSFRGKFFLFGKDSVFTSRNLFLDLTIRPNENFFICANHSNGTSTTLSIALNNSTTILDKENITVVSFNSTNSTTFSTTEYRFFKIFTLKMLIIISGVALLIMMVLIICICVCCCRKRQTTPEIHRKASSSYKNSAPVLKEAKIKKEKKLNVKKNYTSRESDLKKDSNDQRSKNSSAKQNNSSLTQKTSPLLPNESYTGPRFIPKLMSKSDSHSWSVHEKKNQSLLPYTNINSNTVDKVSQVTSKH